LFFEVLNDADVKIHEQKHFGLTLQAYYSEN
jgi:hypothetical protein